MIISNCVINLSPDKPAVYAEAFRALKPGGRLAVSDVVATADLPEEWKKDQRLLCSCISGASRIEEVTGMLRMPASSDITVPPKEQSREFIQDWEPGRKARGLCSRRRPFVRVSHGSRTNARG